jgi:hypothetical protein
MRSAILRDAARESVLPLLNVPLSFGSKRSHSDRLSKQLEHLKCLVANLKGIIVSAANLSDFYHEVPELWDILKVIPMSLDEWVLELKAKIAEITGEAE